MNFQISKIVLWPKRADKPPRIVAFGQGKLNVISGVSRTGKSAIIPIIDYCLGAGKCTIPTGVIRDASAWFGVVVVTPEGEKLFARREPGLQQATDDMFASEAPKITIPSEIVKNTMREAVKQRLDHLAGLTKLSFSQDGAGMDLGRPSFRDLSAFIFQPQNIVANPNVLFYKADTIEHRQKLRSIFPYVLGAVTAETLARQHELVRLQRELRHKVNDLAALQNLSARWRATIRARFAEARDLGLANPTEAEPVSDQDLLDRLAVIATMRRPDTHVTQATIGDTVDELGRLASEESEISEKLSNSRRRISEMEQLKANAAQFRDTVHVQRDRLSLSKWLGRQAVDHHDCPICGNSLELPARQLDHLLESLEMLEQTAAHLEEPPPSFDREMERLQALVTEQVERLNGVNIRQRALTQQSAEARSEHYGMLAASRFLGRLEADLATFESVGQDGELAEEVETLRRRVSDLEKLVSKAQVTQRTQRALNAVDLNAGRLMPFLDAERPNDPIALSDAELTIRVQGADRDDFLWEIGSGSNWLSYHVAVTLALQEYFLTLPACPVPSFLVYDQPSQVYFPRRLVARPTDAPEEPAQLRDEDVQAVQKILKTMASVVAAAAGRFQVIVLDHAAESVWGEIPDVEPVEDWRDGRALVPRDWL